MARSGSNTMFVEPYIAGVADKPAQSAVEFGPGAFTLLANTTYYYVIGSKDASRISAHFRWDATIVITSMTVEDCDFPPSAVTDYASGANGEWIDEDPSTAFVGTRGAGVTVTNGVVAVAGGAAGGCRFNVTEQAARRTRIAVVVGATGGEVVCSTWGKE